MPFASGMHVVNIQMDPSDTRQHGAFVVCMAQFAARCATNHPTWIMACLAYMHPSCGHALPATAVNAARLQLCASHLDLRDRRRCARCRPLAGSKDDHLVLIRELVF